jgi:NAD(P)-dependent dehydrogenase (short-subunit alcohol dehydrogenase family)
MSQKVLVTGTNSGFGRLLALELARKGHTVFGTMRETTGRNRAAAEELRGIAQRENLKLDVLEMELNNDASVDAAVGQVLRKVEYLDVVVNNAGYANVALEETLTPAQLLEQFNVNVVGPHRVTRAALPAMRARRQGLIIHISSGLGRVVLPFMGAYSASKAALEALADAYRYELKPTGVESVIVQPGAHPTDWTSRALPGQDAARAQGYGPLANGPEQMLAGFKQALAAPHAQEPKAVVQAILGLMESPAGTRPERVVVDTQNAEGVNALNGVHAQVQKAVLNAFGMGQLAG